MINKRNRLKILSFIASFSVISVAITSCIFGTQQWGIGIQEAKQKAAASESETEAKTKSTDEKASEKTEANSKTIHLNRVNVKQPKEININNPSALPNFTIGNSRNFSFQLNSSTSKPAVDISSVNFSNNFLLSSACSSEPLSPESFLKDNAFIGYRRFSSANEPIDVGAKFNQQYENKDGNNFSANSRFYDQPGVFFNPDEVAVFSISLPGVKTNTTSQSNLGYFKMIPPSSGDLYQNWTIDNETIDNVSNIVSNTKFFYNMVIVNNGQTYSFYAPEDSTDAVLTYNGKEGVIPAPDTSVSASTYVASLLSDSSLSDFFTLNVTNSLTTEKENFEVILTPNDENGIINVDLKVKNYVEVTPINGGLIYNIIPSYTFEDVIIFQGFKQTNEVELDFKKVINLNNVFDEETIDNLIPITNIGNEGFGISTNYAKIFGHTEQGISTANRFMVDWPTMNGINADNFSGNQVFTTENSKPVKFIDFANVGGAQTTPQIITNFWEKMQVGNNVNEKFNYFYASLGNIVNNPASQQSSYVFDITNTTDKNQWLSLSTWNGYDNYLFKNTYSSRFPVEFNNNKIIEQPFQIGNESHYFSVPYKILEPQFVDSNQPIAVNLRVRNDKNYDPNIQRRQNILALTAGIGESSAKPIMFGGGVDYLQDRYGSYLSTIPGGGSFEYLTGIFSQYDGNGTEDQVGRVGYWMSPKVDTEIVVPENGGIQERDIANILASDFIKGAPSHSSEPGQQPPKINLTIKGGIINTLTDMRITATPDDYNGVLTINITPGIGVNADVVKNNVSDSGASINEYSFKTLEPISFKIRGFKKQDILSDTIITSNDFNISSSTAIPGNPYITFAIDDYLSPNQTISQFIMDKRFDLVADVIAANFKNVYNLSSKTAIQPYDKRGGISAELKSQISNVSLKIPEQLKESGYNYLDLSFDLRGYVEGGAISELPKNYHFKIQFVSPEKIHTGINPKVNLAVDTPVDKKITIEQIKYILDQDRYSLFNFLLTGEKDFTNRHPQNTPNEEPLAEHEFKVPVKKVNNQTGMIEQLMEIKPVKKNEFIFGYPSNFYKAYNTGNSNLSMQADTDELAPINSWTIDQLSINDASVSFTLNLKYFVNGEGIITTNNGSGLKLGVEFIGAPVNKKITTLTRKEFTFTDSDTTVAQFETNVFGPDGDKSLWNEKLAPHVLAAIQNLPNKPEAQHISNIVIAKQKNSFDYANGIVRLDISLKHASTEGGDFDAQSNIYYPLGTIVIDGFKKVSETILSNEIIATIPLPVDVGPDNSDSGGTIYPSALLAQNLTMNQLKEIIKKQGFSYLPDSENNEIRIETELKLDGNSNQAFSYDYKEGAIILNPKAKDGSYPNLIKLIPAKYYNEQGQEQNSPSKNFLENRSITIRGFKKARPTSLTRSNYQFFGNKPAMLFRPLDAKNIIIECLQNYQDIEPRFTINDIVIRDDDWQVTSDKRAILFTPYLKRGFDQDGKYIPIDQKNESAKNDNEIDVSKCIKLLDEKFVIHGFVDKNFGTTAVESGFYNADFNKYIASNYVNFKNVPDEDNYNDFIDKEYLHLEKIIKKTIVDSLDTKFPLIVNAPNDQKITERGLGIDVKSVNNTTGTIRIGLTVKSYLDPDGSSHGGTDFIKWIGDMEVKGFKALPAEETKFNDSVYPKGHPTDPGDNDNIPFFIVKPKNEDLDPNQNITGTAASYYISQDAYAIFNNLPSPVGKENKDNLEDNPIFTAVNHHDVQEGDLIAEIHENGNYPSKLGGVAKVKNVFLLSYYKSANETNLPGLEGVIWVHADNKKEEKNLWKHFGQFHLKGFYGWEGTSIINRVDVRKKFDEQENNELADLISLTPSEVLLDPQNIERLKRYIKNHAILNWSPTANPWEKFLEITSTQTFNKEGEIRFDIKITNWRENGNNYPETEGGLSSTPLIGSVTLFGFQPSQPTQIPSEIRVDNRYSQYFPHEVNDNMVKEIILGATANKSNALTIEDVKFNEVVRSNFGGTIVVHGLQLTRNYFDSNGNFSDQPKFFNDVLINNFRSASTATSFKTEYSINSPFLPIQYEKIHEPNNYVAIKNIIIDLLIVGKEELNLDTSNLVIKDGSIMSNNVAGTLSFTVELDKWFNSEGILIDDGKNKLSADITFNSFATIQPTRFLDKLVIDNVSNITPSDYLKNQEANLKSEVFNRAIIGKWNPSGNHEIDLTENDLVIKPEANNLNGTITLNVSLKKWIDSSGAYRNDQPLKHTIVIEGFKSVKVTYFSTQTTSYNKPGLAQTITEQDLKDFVYNYMIINKPVQLNPEDISIDYAKRQYNNKLGQLSFTAKFLRHYYDENGVEQSKESKPYVINLVTQQTISPTSIRQQMDISSFPFAQQTAYQFASNITTAKNDLLTTVLDLANVNTENFLFENVPNGFSNDDYNIKPNDIEILTTQADNGKEVIGTPINGADSGELILKINLNKYYDSNKANIVSVNNNYPPRTFETKLVGFEKVTEPTKVPNRIELEGNWDKKIASDFVADLGSKSIIADQIVDAIKKASGNAWDNGGATNSNLKVNSLVADNINGTINASVQIKSFTDENGLVYENSWSNNYQILIVGFAKVRPTQFHDKEFFLGGTIQNFNQEAINILKKDFSFTNIINSQTRFDDLNLSQLKLNKHFGEFISLVLFEKIKQELEYTIVNPTTNIVQLFENEFNYGEFNRFFKLTERNFAYDYVNGTISLDLDLASYYSSFNGSLIEGKNPLSSRIILTGFKSVKTTSINQSVYHNSLKNILAQSWEDKNNQLLKRFIFKNVDLFIKNPSYSFSFADIAVDNIKANNLVGTLTFTLTVKNYFGEDGNYHRDDKLSRTVILSGFKTVSATTMRTLIDIEKEPILSVNNIEELTPELIKDALYGFKDGTESTEPIFINQPDKFGFDSFEVLDQDKWTKDYEKGTVVVPIVINTYIDTNGKEVENSGEVLKYNLTISGFNKQPTETILAKEVNVSAISGLKDKLANRVLANEIQFQLNTNKNFTDSIFKDSNDPLAKSTLPSTFNPYIDIRNVKIVEANEKLGELSISFEYRNYFKRDVTTNKIVISNEWTLVPKVLLKGFKTLMPTTINNLTWDLKNTNAKTYFTGNVSTIQLGNFANEVKNTYIENPLYDSSGVYSLTNIIVKEINDSDRNSKEGKITAKVALKNYVNANGEEVKGHESETFNICFTGFNAHDATATSQLENEVLVSFEGKKTQTPSNFLKTSGALLDLLNKEEYLSDILGSGFYFSSDKTKKTQAVDILGIQDEKSIDDGGKIHIDDNKGYMKFKLKVINTVDEFGRVNPEATTLKVGQGKDANKSAIITLKMGQGKETRFKNGESISFHNAIGGSSHAYSGSQQELNKLAFDSIQNSILPGSDGNESQSITPETVRVELDSKYANPKKGIVTYQVFISSWWKFKTNKDLKPQEQLTNCDSTSIILDKNHTQQETLTINGFDIVNKEKDQLLFYISIAIGGSMLLILVIILIVWLFKKRFQSI